MVYLLTLCFLIALGLFTYRYILYKKDIKELKDEINYILGKDLMTTRLKNSSRDKTLEGLVGEINRLLDRRQELDFSYKKKEEEIREMVASLSHDLRTPLTSIKGYVDILDESSLDERNKSYLTIIKKRVESLEFLTNSFYELSRLELKDYEYDLEYFDIGELLLEVVADFYHEFEKRGLEPSINIGKGDTRVMGDIKSMRRVFVNLVDNAIKYSTSFLEIVLETREDGLSIYFINDTEDLDDRTIGKIFDRFFIMDSARQSESTGLGLYITRKILEDMNYSIDGFLEDKNIKIRIDYRV